MPVVARAKAEKVEQVEDDVGDVEEVEAAEEAEHSLEKERAARKARLLARQEAAKKRKQEMDAKAAAQEEEEEEGGEAEEEEEEEEEVRESMVENAVKFLSNESVKKTPLVRRVAFLEKKGLTQAEITTAMQRVSGAATPAPAKKKATTTATKKVRRVIYEDDDDLDDEQVVVVRKGSRSTARAAAPPPLPPPPLAEKKGWTWTSLAMTTFVTLGAVGGIVALVKSLVPPPKQRHQGEQGEHRGAIEERASPGGPHGTPSGVRGMANGDQSPYSTPQHYGRGAGAPSYPSTPQYQPKTPAQQVEELKDQMSELVKVVNTQQSTLQKVQSVLTTPREAPPSSTAKELESIDVHELKSAIAQLQLLLSESKSPARAAAAKEPSTVVPGKPSGGAATPLQRTATPAVLTPVAGAGAKVLGSSPAPGVKKGPSYLSTTNFSPAPTAKPSATPAYTSKYPGTAAAAYGTPPTAPANVAAPAAAAAAADTTAPQSSPAGYSKSFMDVMNMVQRGEEVPGIRTDIDDSPADPAEVVQSGETEPPPKPWEARLKAKQQRFARPAVASPAPSYLSPKPAAPEPVADDDDEEDLGPKVEEIIDEPQPEGSKQEQPETPNN